MDVPKALVELEGLPLVVHAARRLSASGVVDSIIVTCPRGLQQTMTALVADDERTSVPVQVVEGAGTRQASVRAGLALAGPDVGVVLVHDAARPLAPADLVRRVVSAVLAGRGAVVPGLAVTDTVKEVASSPDRAAERVVRTVDRTLLRSVQTPQGFARTLLDRAHDSAVDRSADEGTAASDDAGLVEALGEEVHVVAGDELAMKVTTHRDLLVAAALLADPTDLEAR